jgi:hypothetical protein
MSIHIGLVPLSQDTNDVFTIYSNRSNLVRFVSPSNNALVDFGEYKIGTHSNSDFIFSHNDSNIITFNSNNISFNREINTQGNLTISGSLNILSDIITPNAVVCGHVNTCNITVTNSLSNGSKVIDCTSNSIETFYIRNDAKGVGYIGGRMGIGTVSTTAEYSLITNSNMYVGGDIICKNAFADTIYGNKKSSRIVIEDASILIDAANVTVRNLVLDGSNSFSNLTCHTFADIKGLLLTSNLVIFNSNTLMNPLKINQRLIASGVGNNLQFGNPIFGNPISVKSQHRNIATDPTIFELSSCGHIVLGDYPTLGTGGIINDYMIRGNIPTNREEYFKGFLNFSSNASDKTTFNVNKSGQLAIGTTSTTALLDIVNSFNGSETGYVKPLSIAILENTTTSNTLPFIKCVTSNETRFHITSNGTVCFVDNPINMYKYNIESESNYLNNIETSTITNSNGVINMSYVSMSNIKNVLTSNLTTNKASVSNLNISDMHTVDAYIENLTVGTFSTGGLGQVEYPNTFAIGTDRLFFKGKNIVMSKNDTLLNTPPPYVNLETDKLIIQTETSTGNVNAYTIYGTNDTSIKMLCKNNSTIVNSFVAHELSNHNGGFALLSKVINGSSYPELHITPIMTSVDGRDPYSTPAIVIRYNNDVYFGTSSFINNEGSLFIRTTNATIDGIQPKSANIGNGMVVFSTSSTNANRFICMNTNSYGSLDIGRGISSDKGPFNKQGGWVAVSMAGTLIISHVDYGVSSYTSGTLHIQIKNGTTKIANVSLSFLRFAGTPEIFNIITHKNPSTMAVTVTAHVDGIMITTDTGSKVCWTSIGSC